MSLFQDSLSRDWIYELRSNCPVCGKFCRRVSVLKHWIANILRVAAGFVVAYWLYS